MTGDDYDIDRDPWAQLPDTSRGLPVETARLLGEWCRQQNAQTGAGWSADRITLVPSAARHDALAARLLDTDREAGA